MKREGLSNLTAQRSIALPDPTVSGAGKAHQLGAQQFSRSLRYLFAGPLAMCKGLTDLGHEAHLRGGAHEIVKPASGLFKASEN